MIAQDNGIKILSKVASVEEEYMQSIFPYLREQLKSCRPKSVAQYAESIFCAINEENQSEYKRILEDRIGTLSVAQQRRVKKILKGFE